MRNNKSHSFLLFLLTFAAMPGTARADAVANITRDGTTFHSASKNIQAVMAGGASYFMVSRQGQKLYDSSPANPNLKLGKLLVAEDGKHVVWMLSGGFFSSGSSANWDQFPALTFYQDGKVLRTYSLSELLVRTNLVSHTTSHVQWIAHIRNAPGTPSPMPISFKPDGSLLEFETTSFRRYVFNPQTGAMLSGTNSPVYDNAELIVYGEVTKAGTPSSPPCAIQISEAKSVKGSVPATSFTATDDACSYPYLKQWGTVALKKAGVQWKVIEPSYRLTTIYNALP